MNGTLPPSGCEPGLSAGEVYTVCLHHGFLQNSIVTFLVLILCSLQHAHFVIAAEIDNLLVQPSNLGNETVSTLENSTPTHVVGAAFTTGVLHSADTERRLSRYPHPCWSPDPQELHSAMNPFSLPSGDMMSDPLPPLHHCNVPMEPWICFLRDRFFESGFHVLAPDPALFLYDIYDRSPALCDF